MPQRTNSEQPVEPGVNLPRACTLSALFDIIMYESNAVFQCSIIEAFLHTYRLFTSMEELRKTIEIKLIDTCLSETKGVNQKLFALNSLRVFVSRWLRPPHVADFESPAGLKELYELIRLLLKWYNILRPKSYHDEVGKRDWSSKYRDESPGLQGYSLLRCMFYGVDQVQLERASRKFESACFLGESLYEACKAKLTQSPEKINASDSAASPSCSSSSFSCGSSASTKFSLGSDCSSPFGIQGLEANRIADVLTAEDQRLFLDLRLPELLLYARKKPAPTVMATIDQFNHVVTALQGSILRLHPSLTPLLRPRPADSRGNESRDRIGVAAVAAWSKQRLSRQDLLVPDPQPCALLEPTYKRARMIALWIDVASELQRLNNLYSMQAVLTGLQTSAIHRLRECWAVVERFYPQHLRRFESMVAMMSHENNYEKLRTVISMHLQGMQKSERARRKQQQTANVNATHNKNDLLQYSAPPAEIKDVHFFTDFKVPLNENNDEGQPEHRAQRSSMINLTYSTSISSRPKLSKRNKKLSSNLQVPGMIPYLGLYTHDLTYLHYASPDGKPKQSTKNSIPHTVSEPELQSPDQSEAGVIDSLVKALDASGPNSPIERSITVDDMSEDSNPRRRIKICIERPPKESPHVVRIGPFYKPPQNNNKEPEPQPEVLINFEKHYREGEFLKDLYLLQYTAHSYDLKVDEKYKYWLDSFPPLSENEARQLSLQIEPLQEPIGGKNWDSRGVGKSMTELFTPLAVPSMDTTSSYSSCSKLTELSHIYPVTKPKSHSISHNLSSRPSILGHPYFNDGGERKPNTRSSMGSIELLGKKTPHSPRKKYVRTGHRRQSEQQYSLETNESRSSSTHRGRSVSAERGGRSRSLSQPSMGELCIRATLNDPLYVSPMVTSATKNWKSVGLGSTPNLNKSSEETVPFQHTTVEKVSPSDSVSDVLSRLLKRFRVPDFRVSEFDLVELHPKNLNRILPATANAYHELCSGLNNSTVKSPKTKDPITIVECACVRRLKNPSMITGFRTRPPPFTVVTTPNSKRRSSSKGRIGRGSITTLFAPDS